MSSLVDQAKKRRKSIIKGEIEVEKSAPYAFHQEKTGKLIIKRFRDLYQKKLYKI